MRVYATSSEHEALLRTLVAASAEAQRRGEGEYHGWQCRLIYSGRNHLYRLTAEGRGDYVVKCFGPLSAIRRIYYGWFGRSKASRSWYNALALERMGVGTSAPLGYAEEHDALGLLGRSYYASQWVEATAFHIHPHMRGLCTPTGFLEALVDFIVRLHRSGVYHVDLSPGNILYTFDASRAEYHFSLVDLNRMFFLGRPLTTQEAARNLSPLACNRSVSSQIAQLYARAQEGWSVQHFTHLVNAETDAFWLKRLYKHSYRFSRDTRAQSFGSFFLQSLKHRAYHLLAKICWGSVAEGLRKREEELYRLTYSDVDVYRHALRTRYGYSYGIAPDRVDAKETETNS